MMHLAGSRQLVRAHAKPFASLTGLLADGCRSCLLRMRPCLVVAKQEAVRHATQPRAGRLSSVSARRSARPAGDAAQRAPRGCADVAALEWGAEGYLADAARIAGGATLVSHGCVRVMHSLWATRALGTCGESERSACSWAGQAVLVHHLCLRNAAKAAGQAITHHKSERGSC